jgi:hypothetical protein
MTQRVIKLPLIVNRINNSATYDQERLYHCIETAPLVQPVEIYKASWGGGRMEVKTIDTRSADRGCAATDMVDSVSLDARGS